MAEIGVSVICNAYNEEAYIRDTLDGFVMQKTNFPFEVLVHDDASADRTADVIREYEAKYPDLIKGYYETENQYSQGVRNFTYAKKPEGKYTTFCEGDDYWTDPLKLQRQFDAMEAHPECDICTHAAVMVADGKTIARVAPSRKDAIFTPEHVILGCGGFVVMCCLFLRTSFMENQPEFIQHFMFDYALQIGGSLRGGMVYLHQPMSAYRRGLSGSWSSRMSRPENVEKFRKHLQATIGMLREVDDYTDGKYRDAIRQVIAYKEYQMTGSIENSGQFYKRENRGVIALIPAKDRLRMALWAKVPHLMKAKKKVKGLFRKE